MSRKPGRGVGSMADNGGEKFYRLAFSRNAAAPPALPFRKRRPAMGKERPTDDPRNESDWANTKQTDQPWKGLPEKDQRPNKAGKPDLERWKDSGTH
jgi:hypothetical protein